MARIFIPAQLRSLTDGKDEIDAAGVSVRELVSVIEQRYPGFSNRVMLNEELSPSLQVSIDGTFSRRGLDARVEPTSEVHFLPVFGGG